MIKLFKGIMMRDRNRFDDDDNVITAVFSFRDKNLQIHNNKKLNDPPFMGCVIDKADAQRLIDFLQSCLDDKKCDKCWNKQIPLCFTGTEGLKCIKCGEFYR